jgi:hypothetical protein
MSSTEVRPKGGPRPSAAPPLENCTPLFSLAAGAAGARVRRASGAVGGGDLRAAGGPCAPAAGVAPHRPSAHASRVTELHPRPVTTRRGLPALSGPHSHPNAPAPEAGQEESEK